jgi:hypothetical protein
MSMLKNLRVNEIIGSAVRAEQKTNIPYRKRVTEPNRPLAPPQHDWYLVRIDQNYAPEEISDARSIRPRYSYVPPNRQKIHTDLLLPELDVTKKLCNPSARFGVCLQHIVENLR